MNPRRRVTKHRIADTATLRHWHTLGRWHAGSTSRTSALQADGSTATDGLTLALHRALPRRHVHDSQCADWPSVGIGELEAAPSGKRRFDIYTKDSVATPPLTPPRFWSRASSSTAAHDASTTVTTIALVALPTLHSSCCILRRRLTAMSEPATVQHPRRCLCRDDDQGH